MTTFRTPSPLSQSALDAAATWHAALHGGEPLPSDRQQQFESWLQQAPEHRQAYLSVSAAAFAVEAMGQAASSSADTGVSSVGLPRPIWRRAAPWMVSLLLLLSCALLLERSLGPQPFAVTASASPASLRLNDGSELWLEGETEVDFSATPNSRRIVLHRGALRISVRPDPSRPFTVASGDTEIRVTGTRFSVEQLRGDRVGIALEEGGVSVFHGDLELAHMSPGERLEVGAAGGSTRLTRVSPSLAWQDDVILIEDRRLDDALAGLDRWLVEDIHIVADEATLDTRVTLAVPVEDAWPAVQALCAEHGLSARRIPGLAVLVY